MASGRPSQALPRRLASAWDPREDLYWATAADGARPCPLCERRKDTFYCGTCVSRGSFSKRRGDLDNSLAAENFAALRMRKKTVGDEVARLATAVEEAEKSCGKTAAEEKLAAVRARVRHARMLCVQQRKKLDKTRQLAARQMQANADRRRQLPVFAEKVREIGKMSSLRRKFVFSEGQRCKFVQTTMAKREIELAVELMDHVFEVREVGKLQNNEEVQDSDEEIEEEYLEIAAGLRDAISTTFVDGRWVVRGNGEEDRTEGERVEIVATSLPTSSAVAATENSLSEHDDKELEEAVAAPTRAVNAALSFATQLTALLAALFDVLPANTPRAADFASGGRKNFDYKYHLAHLDLSVLYLCLLCGVNAARLSVAPGRTLLNLKLLKDALKETDRSCHGLLQRRPIGRDSLAAIAYIGEEVSAQLPPDATRSIFCSNATAGEADFETDWDAVDEEENFSGAAAASSLTSASSLTNLASSFVSSLFGSSGSS